MGNWNVDRKHSAADSEKRLPVSCLMREWQPEVLLTCLPLPNRAIVAQIEAEQHLVNANKELISLFEAKIKVAIDRVWGEAE